MGAPSAVEATGADPDTEGTGSPMVRGTVMRSVKLIAATADRLRRPPRGVVVLLYHRVGRRSALEVDLPVKLFEEQVALLAEQAWTCPIDVALEHLAASAASERDPVVVTFDDGTADWADVAVPVLERHRIPATLYVATDFVEASREFPSGGAPVSWRALGDAVSTGLVTIGSHTHTHALLDRVPPEQARAELDRSKQLIEDRLGVACEHFAYPKALPGPPDVEAVVRARFRSAAVGGTHPNRYGRTDPHRLARSPVQVADGMRYFRKKLAGGMALEDGFRRILNRRRYAGSVT